MGSERQIYAARKLAQEIANRTGRTVSFMSESGKEIFHDNSEEMKNSNYAERQADENSIEQGRG